MQSLDQQPLVLKYAIFALISIVTNLLVQSLLFKLYTGRFDVYLAMAGGTLIGLLVKYVLDKNYIFYYTHHDNLSQLKTFFIYGFMGGVTTLIFCVFELGFHYLFDSHWLTLLGGLLGMIVGFITKYQLDKRFTFIQQE